MIINSIDFTVTCTDIYFEMVCIYTHIYISINNFLLMYSCFSVMLVSAEHQSESAICCHFFSLPSCIGVNLWYKFSRSGDNGHTSLITDLSGINFLNCLFVFHKQALSH